MGVTKGQNGRVDVRQSRVHPNDRNLASRIPLWEGTSHLQAIEGYPLY